jgi:hypothetical protein
MYPSRVKNDRVFVTLKQDAKGYPPWDEEEIWAIPAGENQFQLDASPTFARGLSHRDIVHVVPVGERWYIDRVVKANGHSTIRVILFKDDWHDALTELGNRHGLAVDHTELQGLFAIDVPPEGPFRELVRDLEDGQRRGWWDYEEGAVSAQHESGGTDAQP